MNKKRIMSILLALALMLCMQILSFANDTNDVISSDIIVEDQYSDFIGKMSYSEYMEYLYGADYISAFSIPGVIEHKTLDFIRYAQADSRWSAHKLLKGSNTIGSHGCALTSTAMVVNYFGSTDNPRQVNDKLLPWQPANDGGMQWGHVPNAYPVYLAASTAPSYATVDAAYNDVRGHIRLNRPVIIGVTRTVNDQVQTHFVAARGILETEYNMEFGTIDAKYIYIHDPAGRNYTQLSQYINDGYRVHRIIAYRK